MGVKLLVMDPRLSDEAESRSLHGEPDVLQGPHEENDGKEGLGPFTRDI